jgi:uncharacterized protein involved in response to NO
VKSNFAGLSRVLATTSQQVRSYRGPAVLSYGFRPFFLAGALWAAVAVALWLPMLSGQLQLPSAFSPVEWHVHELIYGYVPAIIAGFLLTAVPNWTGRLPVTGTPLLVLFMIWLIGRLAVLCSLWVGPWLAAVIDLSFLGALGVVIAREVLAGNSIRNVKIVIVLVLLFAGNAAFHFEALFGTGGAFGTRIGISAAILLVMIVGGRIIPSFTRNWLVKKTDGRLPSPFDSIDVGIICISAAALASWIIMPGHVATAVLSLLAAMLNVIRLGRWAGERTFAEPLVLILHAAYAFVAVGFLLLALSIWLSNVVAPSGALHSWTVGVIGPMTLAVMTRVSLGHTGQALTATASIQFIYCSAFLSACARIAAAFDILREQMLYLSATFWVLAFFGFVVAFAPLLLRSRP